MQVEISDRDREILNVVVSGWQDGRAPLYGGMSYQEAFGLFDRLGLDKPVRIMARLEELQVLSRKYQEEQRTKLKEGDEVHVKEEGKETQTGTA